MKKGSAQHKKSKTVKVDSSSTIANGAACTEGDGDRLDPRKLLQAYDKKTTDIMNAQTRVSLRLLI